MWRRSKDRSTTSPIKIIIIIWKKQPHTTVRSTRQKDSFLGKNHTKYTSITNREKHTWCLYLLTQTDERPHRQTDTHGQINSANDLEQTFLYIIYTIPSSRLQPVFKKLLKVYSSWPWSKEQEKSYLCRRGIIPLKHMLKYSPMIHQLITIIYASVLIKEVNLLQIFFGSDMVLFFQNLYFQSVLTTSNHKLSFLIIINSTKNFGLYI